eukprot:CAMPEP_0119060892 /NCGR_PEP_ID=MMETSP1178-20130426/4788_1 /TAXON_ID=33656 /ORGANISM="unid sp, Strain CCMP2000" /LENGTH=88 /DNA_ID=CAMNT_0007042037 /DNA_START=432 /DNA_END=698 /DNA_ORIENTATION=+
MKTGPVIGAPQALQGSVQGAPPASPLADASGPGDRGLVQKRSLSDETAELARSFTREDSRVGAEDSLSSSLGIEISRAGVESTPAAEY